MKKLYFLVVIILASCAPQTTAVPTATVTLPPPPTATIIPTPTVNPAFLALQEFIAGSTENYTIAPEGIYGPMPDGTTGVVPGIRLNPDGKGYTIMVGGQAVTIDANDVTITDENGVQVKGYQNADGDDNYEKITTYTTEQIKAMSNTEILNAAVDVDGLEKFISPAGKHIVLYRNGEKQYTQAYNLLTKEMVDVIHVSTDPEKPTKITLSDVESGKLAMSEHLQCPGFPDTAMPIDWRYVTAEGYYTRVMAYNQPEDYSDPATKPQKYCSFSEITMDLGRGEMPYILIGVANLNKDRTIGFLHGWTRPEDLNKFLVLEGNRFFGVTTEEIMNDVAYPEKRVIIGMTPDIEEWGQRWADTDILPEELEKCLVQF
ncbi:MAG: hypothetical protein HY864_12520 [Chloroflexi bacterium]|nr:hypothetical protein [Chloroflexota bacterium]